MSDDELKALARARAQFDEMIGRRRDMDDVKPGYKTTEFWLSTVAILIGLAYGSGLISDGSQADKIVGFIAAALSSFGYSVSRGLAKK
jgi:hypothetical protein